MFPCRSDQDWVWVLHLQAIKHNITLRESKNSDERGNNLESQVVSTENQSNSTKLQAPDPIPSGMEKRTGFVCQSRPGDVSNCFLATPNILVLRLSQIRKRFGIILIACQLSVVNVEAKTVLYPLMETTFSRGPALVFIMDEVIIEVHVGQCKWWREGSRKCRPEPMKREWFVLI